MKKAIVGAGLSAAILFLVPQASHALSFYSDGYGGFTDPNEQSQIDAGLPTAGFVPPTEYLVQNPVDTDVAAFHAFGWDSDLANHSHLSINELTPLLPPAESNYADRIEREITVSNDLGSEIGFLTHHNEVVSAAFGPDYVGIHYHLDLYSDPSRSNLVWSSGALDFTLEMLETANRDYPCPDGSTDPVLCPDRFRIALGLTTDTNDFGDTFDQVVDTFTYMGTVYEVSVSGFWDDEANLIGTAWSEEGEHSTFGVRAEVHVPEPGVSALLATTGLLALGLALCARSGSASSA